MLVEIAKKLAKGIGAMEDFPLTECEVQQSVSYCQGLDSAWIPVPPHNLSV